MNEITLQENNNLQSLESNNIIVKDGKYKRVAQYEYISTVSAETEEEQFKLASILVDGEGVKPFKEGVNEIIELVDVITSPYESVNELTGEIENGVTCTLFSKNGDVYATSSKVVYFKLMQLFKIFGLPGQSSINLKLQIVQEYSKFSKNKVMNLKLVK